MKTGYLLLGGVATAGVLLYLTRDTAKPAASAPAQAAPPPGLPALPGLPNLMPPNVKLPTLADIPRSPEALAFQNQLNQALQSPEAQALANLFPKFS